MTKGGNETRPADSCQIQHTTCCVNSDGQKEQSGAEEQNNSQELLGGHFQTFVVKLILNLD